MTGSGHPDEELEKHCVVFLKAQQHPAEFIEKNNKNAVPLLTDEQHAALSCRYAVSSSR